MTDNSEKDQKLLTRVRQQYEDAITSSAYTGWRTESDRAWDFYDGYQWTPEEEARLNEHGQPAIVINRIGTRINNLVGSSVTARTKVAFRPRDVKGNEKLKAEALTKIAYHLQDEQEVSEDTTDVWKDGLICGIGWMSGRQGIVSKVEIDRVDPRKMYWDVTDDTKLLTNMRYCGKREWVGIEEAKVLFPDHADALQALVEGEQDKAKDVNNQTNIFNQEDDHNLDARRFYDDKKGRVLIVEHQWWEIVPVYKVITNDGETLSFYNEDEAKAENKKHEHDFPIMEESGKKFYATFFIGDLLLESVPLEVQINDFTYIPYVLNRDSRDGRPYGVVRSAIDPQREVNKRRSKMMHALNSTQIIMDNDAVDSPAQAAKEVARPDGVIIKRAGKEFSIEKNLDIGASQLQVYGQSQRDLDDTMGVFSESIGAPTTATSGVAQQKRIESSNKNFVYGFDNLRRFRNRMGKMMLGMIQAFYTDHMAIDISGDSDITQIVEFNKFEEDSNGNTTLVNNLSSGGFNIYIEETPDHTALAEESRALAQQVMMNGQAQFLASAAINETIFGFRPSQAEKIASEVQSLTQGASPEQQGAPNPTGGLPV